LGRFVGPNWGSLGPARGGLSWWNVNNLLFGRAKLRLAETSVPEAAFPGKQLPVNAL
jgi:hypothetical protein